MNRWLLIIFIFSTNILFGQNSENSEAVSEWTNITYVDLNNDIISSSNVSMGFLGEFSILSYNISYETGKNNYKNGFFYSHTPAFKYGKIGFNHRRNKTLTNGLKRTNTFSLTMSSNGYTDDLTISPYFNQMYEKGGKKFGYTFYINDFSWEGFELMNQWYPAGAQTQYSIMLLGMKDFKKNRFTIRPEVFLLSALYTHFIHLDDTPDALDIWYWNDFNINLYYGASIEYNLTKRFVLGGKVRSCFNYDVADRNLGYSKSTPYILSIGADYDF